MLIRLAALAATMLFSTAAHAGYVDLTAPVAGHPEQTYADLLGQFVDGFSLTGENAATADIAVPIRVVDADAGAEDDETPGAVTIDTAEAQPFRSGGRQMLAVRVDLENDGGWPVVVLAVFDPTLTLVDYARIDRDRFVGLELLPISREDDGIVVRSSHFNAGENFESTQLVYLSHGELTALPAIEGYTIMLCEYENVATTGYEVWDDRQPGFWPIVANLSIEHSLHQECLDEQAAADAEESDPAPRDPVDPPWTKSAMRTYSFSASLGVYVENSDGITALSAEYGPE